MKNLAVIFTQAGKVAMRQESLSPPGPGQVLVRTTLSAISPGTEMLVYRGQLPAGMTVDASIASLAGDFHYPLKYGYSLVGQVLETGEGVHPDWQGRRVFSFHPHESAFLAGVEELMPIPDDMPDQEAVFLPNMETAVNLVMDGAPLIGERVVVFGQGIVGLLTTALLSQYPLAALLALDGYELRRKAAVELGAQALNPFDAAWLEEALRWFPQGADLVYELSGSPQALDQALQAAGYDSRVVIGSWYGQKRPSLDLGGRFHRSRIRLVSSQVSTIAPALSGRWNKERRFTLAWEMLRRVGPDRLITQRYPVEQAAQAYQLIDQSAEKTIQVVLTYG